MGREPRRTPPAPFMFRRAPSDPLMTASALQGSPCGGESGDRDAERRAGHVVQAKPVTQGHRVGIAPVLSADAQLDPWPHPAALLDRDLHQAADALRVDRLEGI